MLKKIKNIPWYIKTFILFIVCVLICLFNIVCVKASTIDLSNWEYFNAIGGNSWTSTLPDNVNQNSLYKSLFNYVITNNSSDFTGNYTLEDYSDYYVFAKWAKNSSNQYHLYHVVFIKKWYQWFEKTSNNFFFRDCGEDGYFSFSVTGNGLGPIVNGSQTFTYSVVVYKPWVTYGQGNRSIKLNGADLSANSQYFSSFTTYLSEFLYNKVNNFAGTGNPMQYVGGMIPDNTPIIYNPDLLENNNAYNHVCVGYNQQFTILSDTGYVNDFMLYNAPLFGLNEYIYQAVDGVEFLSPVETHNNLIYYDDSSLRTFLTYPDNVSNLNSTGYSSNITDFYGWAFYNVNNNFTDSDNFILNTYKITDVWQHTPNCIEIDYGDHTECMYDPDNYFTGDLIINNSDEYCFYIPTQYNLKVLNTNVYGDIDDTITINGTTYIINSYYFETEYSEFSNDDSYNGFIGGVIAFFRGMATPVLYINSKIRLLYDSLPVPLQYLIISVIVIGILIAIIKTATGSR